MATRRRNRDRHFVSEDNERIRQAMLEPVQAWGKSWAIPAALENDEDGSGAQVPYRIYKWIKVDRKIVFEDEPKESDGEVEAGTASVDESTQMTATSNVGTDSENKDAKDGDDNDESSQENTSRKDGGGNKEKQDKEPEGQKDDGAMHKSPKHKAKPHDISVETKSPERVPGAGNMVKKILEMGGQISPKVGATKFGSSTSPTGRLQKSPHLHSSKDSHRHYHQKSPTRSPQKQVRREMAAVVTQILAAAKGGDEPKYVDPNDVPSLNSTKPPSVRDGSGPNSTGASTPSPQEISSINPPVTAAESTSIVAPASAPASKADSEEGKEAAPVEAKSNSDMDVEIPDLSTLPPTNKDVITDSSTVAERKQEDDNAMDVEPEADAKETPAVSEAKKESDGIPKEDSREAASDDKPTNESNIATAESAEKAVEDAVKETPPKETQDVSVAGASDRHFDDEKTEAKEEKVETTTATTGTAESEAGSVQQKEPVEASPQKESADEIAAKKDNESNDVNQTQEKPELEPSNGA
ncbi:hypothetical protein H4219_002244 [Mycoemilia scoparia]|uniref:Uncharacterized protein n=1 Tax=Mycoemilia scoparia TaxID=417184 RepID=A0A9W8DUM3_9FUNG|nr:hypothetical protein H4219_002244 [Mycoemilia scoparia]